MYRKQEVESKSYSGWKAALDVIGPTPYSKQGQILKLDQVFNAKKYVSFLFLFHLCVGEKYVLNAFICQRERQSLTKPLFFPFPKLPLRFFT